MDRQSGTAFAGVSNLAFVAAIIQGQARSTKSVAYAAIDHSWPSALTSLSSRSYPAEQIRFTKHDDWVSPVRGKCTSRVAISLGDIPKHLIVRAIFFDDVKAVLDW